MAPRLVFSRLTLLAALVLPACATERLEGPVEDLHALATPEPPPAVRPAPGPTVAPGRWRAWVPPQTTAAGDIIAGHWVDLKLEPPRVEAVAPVAPMPRAPKPGAAPKSLVGPPAPPAGGASTLPVAPAAPVPALPTPGQPGGVVPAAAPRTPTLRVPQALRHGVPPVPEEMR